MSLNTINSNQQTRLVISLAIIFIFIPYKILTNWKVMKESLNSDVNNSTNINKTNNGSSPYLNEHKKRARYTDMCIIMCRIINKYVWFSLWCLTPLSTIFQLYRGSQFYWWMIDKRNWISQWTRLKKAITDVLKNILNENKDSISPLSLKSSGWKCFVNFWYVIKLYVVLFQS